MPKATDHIAEMIALTERLLENGLAYEVDGTIYYDVGAFPGYGKLSGQRVEETRDGPSRRGRVRQARSGRLRALEARARASAR